MRHSLRLTLVALAILVIAALGPAVSAADLPVLDDSISAGVVRGNDGFGTASVVVPRNGYITYLVQGEPVMSGRPIEIWTRTRTTDWARVTTRTFDGEGTARYHARIADWTAFQGRIPGDVTSAASAAHGRIATVSTDGSTRIRVDCEEFFTEDPGTVLISRQVAAPVGSIVRVTLCSFFGDWTPSVISSEQLATAGPSTFAGPSTAPGEPPRDGSAGTETWSFRVTARGTGYAVLEFSGIGGDAIWLLVLRVN